MSTRDRTPPSLTPEVRRLMTTEGKYRLSETQFLELSVQLPFLCRWADKVPQSTDFFFVKWEPVLVLPKVAGFTKDQLAIATYLQPLHSQLCAVSVQVLWKADQLIRAWCQAINGGDLIVASTMTRSLMEIAASFGCESDALRQLWLARKALPASNVESLAEFSREADRLVSQVLFGSRVKRSKQDKEVETGVERTNILTLINKAEALSENDWVRRIYDILCDTVHPSIGSNRCFWIAEPSESDEGPILAFSASRDSPGLLGDLPFAIGLGKLWSTQWLGWMWGLFERTRNDICLTAKVYALPKAYWGVVRPSDPSGYCPCGSTLMEEDCRHEFGAESGKN